jgi:NADH-quinone oxidoreductase subunit J
MTLRADELLSVSAVVLGAIGTYLLLPHRHGALKPRRAHVAGGLLAAVGGLLLARFWTPPGPLLQGVFFYAFALAAVVGGVLTVTSRNPVYSALWFASVVLSTSGLFLLAGAQFLAAGTVIVYAGAIVVTFLFVIMLARAEGHATYDRAARSPGRATLTCALLLWSVLYGLVHARTPGPAVGESAAESRLVPASSLVAFHKLPRGATAVAVMDRAVRPTARLDPAAPHVAALGGTLYTDHIIAAEVAGVILFVALVGAAAIATPRPPVRPGTGAAAKPAPVDVPLPGA